jgi:hypothetical protein
MKTQSSLNPSALARQLVDGLLTHHQSILAHFRSGFILKLKITFTGTLCSLLFSFGYRIIPLAKKIFPHRVRLQTHYSREELRFLLSDKGTIIAFSHPSLGDPLRAFLAIYDLFSELGLPLGRCCFPVNLPWYETICRSRRQLSKVNVDILPLLTKATQQRLADPQQQPLLDHIKAQLDRNFSQAVISILAENGCVIIAPSSTRSRYLYTDAQQAQTGQGLPPAISFLLATAQRRHLDLNRINILPVGITLNDKSVFGQLNPFKTDTVTIGAPLNAGLMVAIKKSLRLDHTVTKALEPLVPTSYHYPGAHRTVRYISSVPPGFKFEAKSRKLLFFRRLWFSSGGFFFAPPPHFRI